MSTIQANGMYDSGGNIITFGGGGGGGHTIKDSTTTFTQRDNLKFTGAGVSVTDDSSGNATVVNISGGGGSADIPRADYETSPATATHAIGDIIYYNDKAYNVTSDIAIGDPLVVSSGTTVGNISERSGNLSYEVFGLPGGGSAQIPYSNRNLIDNPFFTVNQRGRSSYTDNGYTFDRWVLTDSGLSTTVTKNNNGTITITNTSTDTNWFYQPIEDYTPFLNKTITISVDVASCTGRTDVWSGNNTCGVIDSTTGVHTWTITPTSDTTDNLILFATYPSASITIKSVKVEFGSVSTLAYDVAPDYAEELAKCQRYQKWYRFVRTPAINSGAGAYVQVDNPMRATPTLTITDNVGGMVTNKGTMASFTGVAVTSFHSLEGDMIFSFTASNPPSSAQDNLCYIYDIRVFADANL